MEVIHCGACRFYEPPDAAWQRDFGFCTLLTSSNGRPDSIQPLAFAEDMEEYHARFRVKPEFGCVSGEAADYIIEVHVQEYAPVKEVKINVIAPTKAEQERGI